MKISFILFVIIFLTGCINPALYDPNIINQQRRSSFIEARPDISEDTRNDILNGKIRIGMSKEEVIASWGQPYKVNRSAGSWGSSEQWIYGYHGYHAPGVSGFITTYYLYFNNNKLSSFQSQN